MSGTRSVRWRRRSLTFGAAIVLTFALVATATAAWPITGRTLLSHMGVLSVADRALAAESRVRSDLEAALLRGDAAWGSPVLLRLFKQESELEAWVADRQGTYRLLRTWPICRWSGSLGPKERQGDGQAPEGYYEVTRAALNPRSAYHLSFNLGYPNAYDRAHRRTGNYLMVHGNCVSIGCYAMGDDAIDEIYTLVAAALAHGQKAVPVHALPFRFEAGWERVHGSSPWLDFWVNLAVGDAMFQLTSRPPKVTVTGKRYVFRAD